MAIVRPSRRRVTNGDYGIAVTDGTAYIGRIATNYRDAMRIQGYAAQISKPLIEFLSESRAGAIQSGNGADELLISALLQDCRKETARIAENDIVYVLTQDEYDSLLRHFSI